MKKLMFVLAVTLSMLFWSLSASAWYRYNTVRVYVGPGYYGGPYYHTYYRNCRWIPGHYDYYGYWVPGRRTCW